MRTHDVCVIGAGPAGSSVARRLALDGHDVCVIERGMFPPRRRLGECFPLAIIQVLEALGISADECRGLRRAELVAEWGGREHRSRVHVVDRGRFDAFLLDAARTAGAHVVQPAGARAVRSETGWRVEVRGPARAWSIRCRIVVDAAGRPGALRGTRDRGGAATTALYRYARPRPAPAPFVRVRAGTSEWLWTAALPDGVVNTMVFVDRARCAGMTPAARANLFATLAGRHDGITRVLARDASASIAVDVAGDDYVRVGDAAITIDPLSSQGVKTAVVTGLRAAAVVNTLLRRPSDAGLALEFYRASLRRTATTHAALAAEHYGAHARRSPSAFWRDRSAPAPRGAAPLATPARLARSPGARIIWVPALKDGFITRMRAVTAPDSPDPIGFVGGAQAAVLLDRVRPSMSVPEILEAWSGLATEAGRRYALTELVAHGALIDAAAAGEPEL
jgi:flavin-dependent dehydrogenase